MMWNRCEIYQFSRKLLEPKWSKRHECYVSTGFDREIGGENQEVPPEIANAVHNHACRINDSYPPQTIALISREIGKYALLAVATALRDDSDRPLIGYRYFWLEKPSQDGEIDGIGTLLEWWITQGSPTFQLQPSSSSPKTPPKASSSWLNRHDFLKKYSTDSVKISIKKIEQEKKYSRSPLYLDNITFEDCREFHALALSLQANDSSPLNWAFRVSQLEIPEQFSLVYTQDSEREQLIIRFDRVPESFSTVSEYISSDIQVKRCLLNLAKNKDLERNLQALSSYLSSLDSDHWNWEIIVDKTALKNHNITAARYRALLAILKPFPEIANWLDWLRQRRRNKQFGRAGIEMQQQALDQNPHLEQRLYALIDDLLITEQYKNSKIPDLPKEKQWLLIRSKSFWSDYFYDSAKYYTKSLLIQIDYPEYCQLDNNFFNKILQNYQQKKLPDATKKRYEFLARLFAEVRAYSLAALFYQVSQGEVPADIYTQAEIHLIDLQKSHRSSGLIGLAWANLTQDLMLLFRNLRGG